ncbi:LpqB family beta-propeller domain-containing protein [Streptomyces fuscigenes]|uniref:LpqB family beta-propeller domain-containing protein n=1 Tax=Streptomyces fuscigenes TaxID=1528880 RepID=UPI001F2A482A|nr:LpqB family beta-propeller domain-containing protein [Streptomyces fuscigenes]MCF3961658.1 LpqB family beta-propeller domain-containing protein [Streptomyces fuscigenes]
MGDDRVRRGRGRTGRLGAGLVVLALALAGCASIPDKGDVEPVKASPQDESQVRVYAVPPPPDASAGDIVDGFLEAMTSDDPDFAMARKYLAHDEARDWKPQKITTVLSDAPDLEGPTKPPSADQPGLTYQMHGVEIATIDAGNVYRPLKPASYQRALHLIQEKVAGKKEWRIDALPQGLVLGASDFQRNYRPVDTYFYAKSDGWLVSDPVFIRQRIDPLTRMDPITQAVNTVLSGPTGWLKPSVKSSFPVGTRLQKGTRTLEFDDSNALTVPLNSAAKKATPDVCRMMAAQLFFTLRDLTSTRVGQIALRSGGSSLCSVSGDQAQAYAPGSALGQSAEDPFYLDPDGRLAHLRPDDKKGGDQDNLVPGPLGDGTVKLGSVAISRDERRAAGVAENGKSLYVTSITNDSDLGSPLVTSQGAKESDRLSAPTWDSRGDVWVADRDPDHARLLQFENGTTVSESAHVEHLDGRRIEAVRVSSDGVRIALLLTKGHRTSLEIGRVEQSGSGDHKELAVADLKSLTPQMETVTAVSWAGPSRLVIVGKEAGGVQQMRFVQADGSTSDASVLPGLNQVTAIAAGDTDSRALVAESSDAGVVQLPSGGNWQSIVEHGSSPVYPG